VGERTSYEPGTFCWVDLATTDPEGAKAFYSGLFGWDLVELPAGEAGAYTMASIGGLHVGAIYQQPPDQSERGVPPNWMSYISVEDVEESTRRAQELGADGAVVITPFYYKKILEDEHHEAHYRRIADAAPIPVMIYMIPQFSGVYLMQETIARLAEHPNIIGLKESSGDVAALRDLFRELTTQEFQVMLGGPAIFTQGLELGAAGAIFAVAALAPRACLAVEYAHRHSNFERAEDLQQRLTKLARATTANGVGHLKAAMDVVGYYGFMPRSPMPAPTETERAEIESAIAESGFFEKQADGQWTEKEDLIAPEYAD